MFRRRLLHKHSDCTLHIVYLNNDVGNKFAIASFIDTVAVSDVAVPSATYNLHKPWEVELSLFT
jgi:hypothetical protein